MRSGRPGHGPAMLWAVTLVAGCSLTGRFDEPPPVPCVPGEGQVKPGGCGCCGRGTAHEICADNGSWTLQECRDDPDDLDGDRYTAAGCGVGYESGSCRPGDCNDGDPLVNPGRDEACNAREDRRRRKSKVKAELFTGLLYRHWNHWRHGKVKHVFHYDLQSGRIRDLTPGGRDALRAGLRQPGFQ